MINTRVTHNYILKFRIVRRFDFLLVKTLHARYLKMRNPAKRGHKAHSANSHSGYIISGLE